MSASLLVDLQNTCQQGVSIAAPSFPTSGGAIALSGGIIGQVVDMINANTFCNLQLVGQASFPSGELRVAIQDSDSTASGTFTDPTSGLAQIPPPFVSGGILYLNSGGVGGGTFGALTSGQALASGFAVAAGFQRQHRYVRAVFFGSGAYCGPLQATFISNLKTTGSGGGFSYSPGSGVVNV